jgi:Zn-dependent protease with chaperone function
VLWAILTAVLVATAYVVALAIAAGCGYLSLVMFGELSFIRVMVGLAAAVCAVSILWSLIPRWDRFTPPSQAFDPARQPRLFQEIAAIADEFEEPMPESVYLILEPNAWVAQRGGLLGFGSRRVMAIGLPLFSTLSVAEFRAILAHEFAHYYGGDTGFGVFIERARDSLIRSLESLSSSSGILAALSRLGAVALLRFVVVSLFGLYWRLFLWLIMLTSRQWEYRADELACAVAGATPFVSGLRKLTQTAIEWRSFLETEFSPALQMGVRLPLSESFARYRTAPQVSRGAAATADELLAAEKPDVLHSHPTFRQRAARALVHGPTAAAMDERPAGSLLADTSEVEQSALKVALPGVRLDRLRPVAWERLAGEVFVPSWYAFAAEYRELLAPYQVRHIPDLVLRLGALAAKVRDPKGALLTREQRADRSAALLWNAFALALLDSGWELKVEPGECSFVRGEGRLNPSQLVAQLRAAEISPSDFRTLVHVHDVAALPLAPAERLFPTPDPNPIEPESPQLVIRPRARVLRWQWLGGTVVFTFLAVVLWLTVLRSVLVFAGVGLIALCLFVADLLWFRRRAPKAIVADSKHLAITWRDGRQQRIAWPSILLAVHTAQRLANQWELTLKSEGSVFIRDTGIDSDRWAILRNFIIHFANQHSVGVTEDSSISEAYREASEAPE